MTSVEFNNSSEEAKKKGVTWIEGSPYPMPYAPFEPKVLFRLWGNPGEYGAIERDVTDLRFMQRSNQEVLAKIVIERAMRIRTYNENFQNESTEEFKKIILSAHNIIFIGFAFHKQNLDVLGLSPNLLRLETQIYGTAYGLSNQELAEKMEVIRRFINIPSPAIKTLHIYNAWPGFSKEEIYYS